MGTCPCGDCICCDLAELRRVAGKPQRGGIRVRFERVTRFAQQVAARAGLEADEVVELLARGRTTRDLALLSDATEEELAAWMADAKRRDEQERAERAAKRAAKRLVPGRRRRKAKAKAA